MAERELRSASDQPVLLKCFDSGHLSSRATAAGPRFGAIGVRRSWSANCSTVVSAVTHYTGIPQVAALGFVLLAFAGCASPYAYDFHLIDPATVEDQDLSAQIRVDVAAAAVLLELTNKTDEVLQVEWGAITLTHNDGSVTSLRPDVDLGWLQPHATIAARLFAIALPHAGSKAAAYEGQRFQLNLPTVVRREPKLYRYAFSAHVRKL